MVQDRGGIDCAVYRRYNILINMDIFTTLFIFLLIATAIFYVVLFSFIYYWHLVKASYVIVPLIFTFEFFATGFLIICIISVILNYLPEITALLWR